MPAPDVSVVIPLYNSAEWITSTLHSLQQQTLDPARCEIILVDSASIDHGAQLAEAILSKGHSPFHIIRLDHNPGPSQARNIGWKAARASWIQFLDSDDLLLPGKLEHQLRAADSASSDVAVIYSEWQNYVLDGEWKPAPPLKDPILETDLIRGLLQTEHFLATGSQLIRKSWLTRLNGFDEACWVIEDVHLMLRLAMHHGTFLRAPAGHALFYYRRRGTSSLSGSRRAEFLNGCVRNFRLAEDYWRATGQLTRDRLDFVVSAYEPLLHNLVEADPNTFDLLLRHLLSIQPGWKPAYDTRMRLLSSVIGYRRAAQLAMDYRRWKIKLSRFGSCF
ncbi:MAG: glycosyltransferase family 2 protein [Acidobacteriaceae bacterium]|nr:glycosyltransferase family 2 protein [Acidobacteriaceae bacterium]